MLRYKHALAVLAIILVLVTTGLAQDREKIKRLTPTHKGSTGLFNLYVADTLRQGEFSISFAAHRFNRDPGDLQFTNFPLTLSVGLFKRIEFFASYEAYKRVRADDVMVYKVLPGDPLQPARLKDGTIAYYNDTPYMDVEFGDGTGDLNLGLKINILSERSGSAFGLAFQPVFRLHMTDNRQHLLRGLTSGKSDGGFDFIASKNLGGGATWTGNAGFMFAGDLAGIKRQNRFNWGTGFEVPLGTKKVSLIGEVVGSQFYGDKGDLWFVNARSPIEAYAGVRLYPSRWLVASAALNYKFTQPSSIQESGCVGFYVQASLNRKINEPPTVECSATSTTVIEGDSTTVNAEVFDPDDDVLNVTWKASGGVLSQQDDSATLDTSGLDPGRYSVMVEVSDGEKIASCSEDITVEKRKMPPTISCGSGSATVTEGQSITLSATASDPNNDPLTYSWTVDGQAVTNNRSDFEFGTAGRSVGQHKVRVTVTDVDNMSASCEHSVTISLRPNLAITLGLSLSKNEVFAGEKVAATARATDPENDPINYTWKVDGQSRSETGSQITINTAGMAGGSHSVTVTASDDRGASASDTKSFNVVEKVVIPMDKLRPDNKAKAQLDEIALKLQQNPQLRARITGHTDDKGSEEANIKVGMKRAEATKAYLVKQHNIDENRIETKSAGESAPIADNGTDEGRKQNRRVEVELFVP